MPSRSSTQLATPLVSRISGVKAAEKSTCGPDTTRAVCSGTAMARYWATSSPKTIDTEVATNNDAISAVAPSQRSGTPTADSTGASNRAITGSAR